MSTRTYSHLEALGRKPSAYEIATSRLLPYAERGFEVTTQVAAWYEKHQRGSCLRCSDWEKFSDPRETTYASYVARQSGEEQFMDGMMRFLWDTEVDARIAPLWIDTLGKILPPARYPAHALQMLAAYVGSMAPSGRIAVAALFQAADEMRRVHRLSYRMRQIQKRHVAFGSDARAIWETSPLWQPLRRMIELLLVTYDWGEAFVAVNLVLKPMFDEFFLRGIAQLVPADIGAAYGAMTSSLQEDAEWHLGWSRALVRMLVADAPENTRELVRIVTTWAPLAFESIRAFGPAFGGDASRFPEIVTKLEVARRADWHALGIDLAPTSESP